MQGEESDVSCSWWEVEAKFWSLVNGEEVEAPLLLPPETEPVADSESPREGTSLDDQKDFQAELGPDEWEGLQYLDVPLRSEPPPWGVRFTATFRHDLKQLDRKLQGRLLETILEITKLTLPFAILGDTFKPLQGELKGLWRYRIGDHRLVIKPIEVLGEIELVTFAARGSVYD